ncbi:DnaJ domain-containing protein [Brachybacterium sp. J144]|uniref:J domain-containing protein n=1 Tax=Brachybacterium sp. J144 TaxID=3116487 RepID=UPI002E7A96DA|nr:DnaJ domain-containing protein [Brachybacterium sp. J144]MEE1652094.1 DnaJ domain-containing protein [Brachybacterium sp. J144]
MPTSEPTLYEVLGVAPDADPAEIKAAFRKRARKMHPDVAGDEMRSFYLLLQHAHEVLSEPGRRAEYDRSLRGGAPSSSPPPPEPETRAGAASEEPPTVWGERVPDDVYGGPLPREGHDISRMPWLRSFEGVERSSAVITHGGLRWWQTALIGAGGLVLVVASYLLSPLVVLLLPGLLWAGLRIWWIRRVPEVTSVLLLAFALLSGAMATLVAVVQGQVWQWPVLGTIGSLLGIFATLWAVYDLAVREPLRARRRDIPQGFSWGEPGQNLADGQGRFSLDATLDGIEGERLTAAELAWFLGAIPGVRLVNSIEFPGTSSGADVDHAVACGDKVAFIDSKAWKPGQYALVGGQDAIRVGTSGAWDYRPAHMPTAVRLYQALLAKHRLRSVAVRGYIVVHPKSQAEPLRLSNDSSDGPVRLVTARELVTELGAWFTEDEEHARSVNRRLLSFLLRSGR